MVTTAKLDSGEITPIIHAEFNALMNRAVELMKIYDLESISLYTLSGDDGEKPYRRLRLVDKTGRGDTWLTDWESE